MPDSAFPIEVERARRGVQYGRWHPPRVGSTIRTDNAEASSTRHLARVDELTWTWHACGQ